MSDSPVDEEYEKQAEKLFSKSCQFLAGAATHDAIPLLPLPEVAFAGRSNVGKSSLINALTHRTSLARVSQTPGRTRQLNFFSLDDQITLVDLPGYGYAQASKTMIAGWEKLIKDYLRGRVNLQRVFLLIDSRHGLKKTDEAIMTVLDEAPINYQIVLTKADKTSASDLSRIREQIEQEAFIRHPALHPELLITSSKTATGLTPLRCAIYNFTLSHSSH